MKRRDITAQRTSFPFSSYVVGHHYVYDGISEVGVGDLVQVQIGYFPANRVIEVSTEIFAEARVVAVDTARGTVKVTIAADARTGNRAVVNLQPGSTVELPLIAIRSVLTVRIFEPDSDDTFTDLPVVDAYELQQRRVIPDCGGGDPKCTTHGTSRGQRDGECRRD